MVSPEDNKHKEVALFTTQAVRSGKFRLPDACELVWEIHGNGPKRVCLVMGLLASKWSWRETVHWLTRAKQYSVLVFDNRGAGESSKPWGRYTTGLLARDAIALLDHVGWSDDRSVNLCGVSMGGMISLEMAKVAPTRFRSLTLTSTCAKHVNPPRTRLESAQSWISFFRPKPSTEDRVRTLISTLFADQAWLDASNPDYPEYRSNYERLFTILYARALVAGPPAISGQVGQIAACLTHDCSFKDLALIGQRIPDTLVVTGDTDRLIDPRCSETLYRELSLNGERQSIKSVVYRGKGHALAAEAEAEYHGELERIIAAGDARYT